ncbi:MAG TPA: DUF6491 family protein [Luteimonas sp.]
MKAFTALASLLLAVTASACASTGMSDADKLATYRAHAGAPVSSFRYFGSINGWTSLGDSAIAVWTRPSEAWLLELTGPCPDIEYAPMIGVTSQSNRVSAKFDKVIAQGGGSTMQFPCRIETIRPLDVKAIKQAEKTARDQPAESSGT